MDVETLARSDVSPFDRHAKAAQTLAHPLGWMLMTTTSTFTQQMHDGRS